MAKENDTEISAEVIRAIDELYLDVSDAGIILADVPGESEHLTIEDRTVTDCINAALDKLDTIFDTIGNPSTRK